jgi:hypothetical protein
MTLKTGIFKHFSAVIFSIFGHQNPVLKMLDTDLMNPDPKQCLLFIQGYPRVPSRLSFILKGLSEKQRTFGEGSSSECGPRHGPRCSTS